MLWPNDLPASDYAGEAELARLVVPYNERDAVVAEVAKPRKHMGLARQP